MKIIIIGPSYPYRGGIADTNESMCRALSKEGHDTSIITFTVQYPSFLFPGKTQYAVDKKPPNISITRLINSINPLNWIWVARKINRLKPDLVIVRYWLPVLAPCLGTIVRLLNKNVVTIAMCDNVIPHEKRLGDRSLTRYFIGAFNGFMTLSKTTLEELTSFTDKSKRYHPHPINDDLGEAVPQKQAREYLGLDIDSKYLLFFGLIREYKGLDLALKALGVEKVKQLNIKLLIVGEFYEPKEKYIELVNQLGLNDNIIIVDEFIPIEKIKYYFSAADLVVQTYKSASQSGISQIAFNFTCPILVTNVGGLSEIVLHQQIGYVCEKEPQEIADSILDYFNNDRRDGFRANMQVEKQKYSWGAFANALLGLYQEIK